MTTGSFNVNFVPPYYNYVYGSWNGVDGKYEVINGKRRIKFNNYTLAKTVHETTPGTYWTGTKYIKVYADWTPGPRNTFTLNDTVKAQSKLATKIKGTQLHLGKNVIEGRQFIDLIRKTLFSVAKVIVNLKNGELKSALRILIDAHRDKGSRLNYEIIELLKRHRFSAADVAGKWLELQYGWKPLLSDVKSAADIFYGVMEAERTLTVRVTATRTEHYNASVSPSNYSLYGLCVLRTKIKYEFAENEVLTLQRSLGLEDPAGIIWEAVPFSFVVDWFMPIGSYLEALNVLPNLKGRWCMTKVIMENAHKVTQKTTDKSYDWNVATFNATSLSIVRTHGEGYSFFNVAPPDIKPLSRVFSPSHIYNAVALATQMISGGPISRR
jgi:hypothetical protein